MGNWNMTVIGLGAHHNKNYETDANELFKDFVLRLKDAGHDISHASFTNGARDVEEHKPECH